jgi:hypothetical protein
MKLWDKLFPTAGDVRGMFDSVTQAPIFSPTQSPPAPRPPWMVQPSERAKEYLVIDLPDPKEAATDMLNAKAALGWKVIATVERFRSLPEVILEREVGLTMPTPSAAT